MSASSHAVVVETKTHSALDELRRFIDAQRVAVPATCDFDQFERELHERNVEVEREILAKQLARYDVDVPMVRVDGVIHFSHWGCRQSNGGVRLIKDTVMEYGIPFLNLDGDCIDERNYSKGQYLTRLEGFMEIIG